MGDCGSGGDRGDRAIAAKAAAMTTGGDSPQRRPPTPAAGHAPCTQAGRPFAREGVEAAPQLRKGTPACRPRTGPFPRPFRGRDGRGAARPLRIKMGPEGGAGGMAVARSHSGTIPCAGGGCVPMAHAFTVGRRVLRADLLAPCACIDRALVHATDIARIRSATYDSNITGERISRDAGNGSKYPGWPAKTSGGRMLIMIGQREPFDGKSEVGECLTAYRFTQIPTTRYRTVGCTGIQRGYSGERHLASAESNEECIM
eukprot:gene16250-biopygen2459